MAGRPIEIAIDITSTDAEKGAAKVTEALGEVEDSLKDLNKTGEKAFDGVSDAATDSARDIDKRLTTALEDVKDKAKTAGKGIGDGVKSGTDKASQGLSEMKDEAGSTAREAAASFGSIEDSADALQETLANSLAGFGPLGAAVGVAAAVGVGLLISSFTESAEKINENKEKMLDLARTIKENGGALTEADYVKQMEDYGYAIQDTKEFFEIFQEDAISGFEKLKKITDETSLSGKDLFKGMFGNKDEAVKTLDVINKQIKELEEKKEAVMNLTGAIIDPVDAATLQSLYDAKTGVEGNIKAQEAALQQEKSRKESIEGTTQALLENIAAEEKRTDAMKDSINAEIDEINALQALDAAISTNGSTMDLNTKAGQDNARAFLETASAAEEHARKSLENGEAQSVVTARANEVREAMIQQATRIYGSRDAAEAYVNSIFKIPGSVNTTVGLNTTEAERKLFELQKSRTIPMHISVDGSAVDNYFFNQQGRKIFVEFAPKGGGQAVAPP